MNVCETCFKECKKSFSKAFCSDRCRFLYYAQRYNDLPSYDCWNWRGKIGRDGYAFIMIQGKRIRAHRYSHRMFYRDHDPNLLVLHSCDNKSCVNPMHLRQGTVQDNSNDFGKSQGHRKGKSVNTCKLDELDVKNIRKLYALGSNTQKSLATMFNVSQNAISYIIRRINWKHV